MKRIPQIRRIDSVEKNPHLSQTNAGSYLKTNPNFNTNAPPFEVRGCKVILGGAFLGQGGAKNFEYKAIQAN